jgi:hypothetical protein
MHWADPALVIEPELEHGPVLVQIQYKIDAVHEHEFALAVRHLGSIRKRDVAFFGEFLDTIHIKTFSLNLFS